MYQIRYKMMIIATFDSEADAELFVSTNGPEKSYSIEEVDSTFPTDPDKYTFGNPMEKMIDRGSYGYLTGNMELSINTWDQFRDIDCCETWDFRYPGIAICTEIPDDAGKGDKFIAGPADLLFDTFVGDSGVVSMHHFEWALRRHISDFCGIKVKDSKF